MIYNYDSQSILHQVYKSYLRLQSIKYNNVFQKQNCSAIGKQFFDNYLEKFRTTRNCLIYGDNLRIFGCGKSIKLKNLLCKQFCMKMLLRMSHLMNVSFMSTFYIILAITKEFISEIIVSLKQYTIHF